MKLMNSGVLSVALLCALALSRTAWADYFPSSSVSMHEEISYSVSGSSGGGYVTGTNSGEVTATCGASIGSASCTFKFKRA